MRNWNIDKPIIVKKNSISFYFTYEELKLQLH